MKTNLQNLKSYSKFQAIKEKVEKRKLKEKEAEKYGFIPPSSGDISSKGKDVLAKVYANCRKNDIKQGVPKESSDSKTKCAKIANSVITKQGYRDKSESYDKFQAVKEKVERRKLKEAEEISVDELAQLDPKGYEFLKDNDLLQHVTSVWDGVHGKISTLKTKHGNVRLEANDLKKIINNKEFRWLDIVSIGYGSGF